MRHFVILLLFVFLIPVDIVNFRRNATPDGDGHHSDRRRPSVQNVPAQTPQQAAALRVPRRGPRDPVPDQQAPCAFP